MESCPSPPGLDQISGPCLHRLVWRHRSWLVLCGLALALAACRPLGAQPPAESLTPEMLSAPTLPLETPEPMGTPPGPVLAVAPLPGGEFLVGVGPVGDAETGFIWQIFRGKEEDWRPLSWPPEAVPRSLHVSPDGNLLFAVPVSHAVLGRGQAWGLMRSVDGGQSWQQALDGLQDPYLVDLAISPAFDRDKTILAVTWYNGVHYSGDGGQHWQPVPYQGSVEPSGGVSPFDLALALSPDFSRRTNLDLFAVDGLLVSSFSRSLHCWDLANQSWRTVPLTVETRLEDFDPPSAQLTAGAIAFSPDYVEDSTLFLYSGYGGLFRSTDGAKTWQPEGRSLPTPNPLQSGYQLAVASAAEIYLLLPAPEDELETDWYQTRMDLYRSLDGGRFWDVLKNPPTLGTVSAFALTRDGEGRAVLHLGGSRGGVSSHPAEDLTWD